MDLLPPKALEQCPQFRCNNEKERYNFLAIYEQGCRNLEVVNRHEHHGHVMGPRRSLGLCSFWTDPRLSLHVLTVWMSETSLHPWVESCLPNPEVVLGSPDPTWFWHLEFCGKFVISHDAPHPLTWDKESWEQKWARDVIRCFCCQLFQKIHLGLELRTEGLASVVSLCRDN